MAHSHRLRPILFVTALVALAPGCASNRWLPASLGGAAPRSFSQEELAQELQGFAARFSGLVATAAEDIAAGSDDPVIRRRTVLLGRRLTPAVQEAAFDPNPRAGYVRLLTVVVTLRYYLTTGDGRNLFQGAQPIAVDVARALEADIFAIGARFLTASELEEVRAEVAALAERFPIRGTQFSLVNTREAVRVAPSRGPLYEVISLPLAPFNALRGVDSGAAAIRDFNQTARAFGTVVASLPGELRGEMQLLLLDAEELRAVRQGLEAFELAAASGERVSLAMERLPDELRATLDQQVRALLDESQQPIEQATRALDKAAELAAPLQATATQIREASLLWREILGAREDAPADPDARPFDVREWEATARAVGASAAELRGLAAELQGVREALQGASLSAGIDRLFWRALALIVAFFALLLGYRMAVTRLAPRERGPV